VIYNRSHSANELGQVLHFRRRSGLSPLGHSAVEGGIPSAAPDDDFARYEQEQGEAVDDRHRMLMNVLAGAIVVSLVTAGVWIADTIAAMQKDQDCVLQGRANCAPIEPPALRR
jgi:hypothetical protein